MKREDRRYHLLAGEYFHWNIFSSNSVSHFLRKKYPGALTKVNLHRVAMISNHCEELYVSR